MPLSSVNHQIFREEVWVWLFDSVQRGCALIERDRFIAQYWYLCRRAARRFVRRGLDHADLEQVGAIGLIKAADRYDPGQRAPPFKRTLAFNRWRADTGIARIAAPRGVRDLERRWNAAERELSTRLGRLPSESDVTHLVGDTSAAHDARTARPPEWFVRALEGP